MNSSKLFFIALLALVSTTVGLPKWSTIIPGGPEPTLPPQLPGQHISPLPQAPSLVSGMLEKAVQLAASAEAEPELEPEPTAELRLFSKNEPNSSPVPVPSSVIDHVLDHTVQLTASIEPPTPEPSMPAMTVPRLIFHSSPIAHPTPTTTATPPPLVEQMLEKAAQLEANSDNDPKSAQQASFSQMPKGGRYDTPITHPDLELPRSPEIPEATPYGSPEPMTVIYLSLLDRILDWL